MSKIESELSQRAGTLRAESDFLLHIEDLWWVQDEESLQRLLALKPFSCSLTWNEKNALASGSGQEGGLTAWGKQCVKRLLDAGVVVDVAHLNRTGFYEVAKLVKKNIYCSHTGFYGVKRHRRNLTDKQIDTIVASDGFVGLFFFDKCTKTTKNKPFSVDDIVKSIDYFTSRWGFDNLGIGSDFYGIDNSPIDLKDYADFSVLAVKLQQNGLTEVQIDKIFSQNFKNFLKRVRNKKRN